MYNAYYGFREKPFKLVPNPDYLFLSKSHEVALAHLTYATDQGDGFVVITGEVGTGKTTLCRIFLERLDDDTESAYIFNPKLDSLHLLTSICNEFGIQTNLHTVKALLDLLNAYLITKNQEERKVILLIDEAQNLTVENLEMVRMLSNLETTRSKLLQIVLVGQPELSDKLDSYELRQLSQRISLNCHLTPMSGKETQGYIQHRVNIAAQRKLDLFSPGACRKIHNYAGGVPRLINIACDRALLSAYSLNRKKITPAIAGTAIKALSRRGHGTSSAPLRRNLGWSALACLAGLAIGIWVVKSNLLRSDPVPSQPPVAQQTEPSETQPVDRAYKIALAQEVEKPDKIGISGDPSSEPALPAPQAEVSDDRSGGSGLQKSIARLDPFQSRLDAVTALLALWKQPKPNAQQLPRDLADIDYFDIAARQYGLRALRLEKNWALIRQLNLPCILSLKRKDSLQPVFLTLMHWKDERLFLSNGAEHRTIEADLEMIKPYFQGEVFLFWKNITGFDFIIADGADSHAVRTVKSLLQRIGYGPLKEDPHYDLATRQAVLDFQSRHNIDADGLVGPVTKIMLINAAKAFNSPQLMADEETGA